MEEHDIWVKMWNIVRGFEGTSLFQATLVEIIEWRWK